MLELLSGLDEEDDDPRMVGHEPEDEERAGHASTRFHFVRDVRATVSIRRTRRYHAGMYALYSDMRSCRRAHDEQQREHRNHGAH